MSLTLQEIVLTSSPDGPITAYDSSSGATLAHFTGSRSPRQGLALVGKKFVAASHISPDTGTGSIHLYNWWSNSAFHNLPVPEPVAPLAATPDGLYLFAGGISGNIHVLILPSGDIVQSFPAHKKSVSCLEICEDSSLLFSGSDDGTIAAIPVYELVNASFKENLENSILCRFVGHQDSVTAITCGFGGSNCTIISCSLDCTCKIWSLMQGTHIRSMKFPCPIFGVVMDSTESQFYAAGSDGLVYKGALKVFARQAVKNGHNFGTWREKHGGGIVSIGMVNEGTNLVTASEEGTVWIWEVETGEVTKVLGKEMKSISGLVVANGFGDVGRFSGRMGRFSRWSCGFSDEELRRPIGEVMEMEERLDVVVHDRRRAINNLESAIGIYEKLLQLILKQTKAGTQSDSDEEKN